MNPFVVLTVCSALCGLGSLPLRAFAQESSEPPSPATSEESAAGSSTPQTPPIAPPTSTGGSTADPAAIERIRLSADAIRNAETISFRLRTSASGVIANSTPVVDYAVKMRRNSQIGGKWTVRVSGEGKRRPTEPSQPIDCLFEGDTVTWVDHAQKKIIKRSARSARGPLLQLVNVGRVPEVMGDEPMASLLASVEAVIEKQEELDGTACDAILLRPKAKASRVRAWVSQGDHLPRKIEKLIESSSVGGFSAVEFVDLRIGESIEPVDVELRTPEGYTEDFSGGGMTARPGAPVNDEGPTDRAGSETPRPTPIVPRVTPNFRPTGDEAGANGSNANTGEQASNAGGDSNRSRDVSTIATPTVSARSVDFDLKLSDGTVLAMSSLRGRPAVLFFGGTWSLPSRSAVKSVEAIRDRFKDAASFVAVMSRERRPESAAEFMRGLGLSIQIAPTGDDAVKATQVRLVPSFVVVDSTGAIREVIEGFSPTTADEIDRVMSELTGMQPSPSRTPDADAADAPGDASGEDSAAGSNGG
jgi:peroxiredoxin